MDTSARRSNRAVKPTTAASPAAPAKKIAKETTATTGDSVTPKRKPGRPLGSTKKNKVVVPVSSEPKVPGKRGRKPLPSTVIARAAAAAAAAAMNEGQEVKFEEQVSHLEISPAKKSNAGRKRKSDATDSGSTSVKRAAVVEIKAKAEEKDEGEKTEAPRKRGRPAGTGKKQIAATASDSKAASSSSSITKAESKSTSKPKKDAADNSSVSEVKLTIERCTTCTQYKSNLNRISKIVKQLYPTALVQEEIAPQSKSFEIYLSVDGSKNKLIWSGKAHAPPKRLAFPDNDVFIGLLKEELEAK